MAEDKAKAAGKGGKDDKAADKDPKAYEKLVDRLLASPRFGERWARHWLDVVRFAESDGFEMNAARANAWPYRDYVIRAFNEDKQFDQFVREQLAGDAFGETGAALLQEDQQRDTGNRQQQHGDQQLGVDMRRQRGAQASNEPWYWH